MAGKNKIGFALIFIAFMAACDSNRVYEQNYDFEGETWHKDSVLEFEVEIIDTLGVYNIYFNNRITGQYPYSNLFLFITTEFPDSNNRVRDTLECFLAEPDGEWLGKGFGNIWTNKIPYRKNIRFPMKGTYLFKIEQAMRTDELPHVLDAGLRIETAN